MFGPNYNPDTPGLQREKPTPRLFNANLKHYEDAIEWVRTFLADRGYYVASAMLDPYVEVWFLYERDGAFITALNHALVEHILEGINAGYRSDHARIQTGNFAQRLQDWAKGDKPQASHRDSPERTETGEEGKD